MPRDKKNTGKDSRAGDRHKKRRMFALRHKLTPIMERLAADAETSITVQINRLLTERLQELGLLPDKGA